MKAVTMIDTIAINLQRNDFTIHEPDRFSPSAAFLNNPMYQGKTVMKAFYNPTKKDKAHGYCPRLTLFKKPAGDHASAVWLKIEFSAPKMLCGNNFEELQGEDFDALIRALLTALERMGIEATYDVLANASVTAIHYSKNILLDSATPCYLLIQTLEKIDLSARLDLTQSDFRNGGQMAKFHAGSYEIALYDKIKDLQQAKKNGERRGAEIDYDCQFDLLDGFKAPEVLRFEVRLKSKKLKSVLKKLGIEPKTQLKDLFCANISRAVLLHYWDQITAGLYIVNIEASDVEKLIDNIRVHFPSKRPNSVMTLMGFINTCQQIGIRGTRMLLNLSDSQFYRHKADAKQLKQNVKSPRFLAMAAIKAQLKEFIPVVRQDIVDEGLL